MPHPDHRRNRHYKLLAARHYRLLAALVGGSCLLLAVAVDVRADKPADRPPEPPKCKAWGSKPQCCDPAIAAHLPLPAVYKACGESDATFLGEQGSKDTCKYVFRVEGQKEDETFVQVYVPAQKEVPAYPNDPFFDWKKVGKAYMTSKAKSPKAAPMMANSTGLWLPGTGYFVSVNASTKVCSKPEAQRLAGSLK